MKFIVFCICVLGFALSNLADSEIKQAFKNAFSSTENNLLTCFIEHNVTMDDGYDENEILTGVYAEPENEEKTRKLSCAFACFLTKEDLMEDSNIKESKVHAKINQMGTDSRSTGKVHKAARDCMKEVKDITEKCEKSFSLFVCAVKAIHKLEKHGEHEEREGAEIQDNEEAEQLSECN